jgi:hypothetical protein
VSTIEATRPSVYTNPRAHSHFLAQVGILAAIGWVGFHVGPSDFTRAQGWILILTLMTGFAVVAGHGMTGYWRGILVDNRNRMSLARLQLLAWTLVVLSAIVTAGLTNEAFGASSPLGIEIPQELWVLLGMSTVSAVAAPAVLRQKSQKAAHETELEKTVEQKQISDGGKVDKQLSTLILCNETPADARWSDLLKGDESGDAATVDLGKLQMFFFTFVLVLGYAVAIARLFDRTGAVSSLPIVDSSVNTLLGISHTGYLANKVVTHSREGGTK